MSYSVMFFAVDTDAVKATFASNARETLDAVLASQSEDIQDHDESWVDDYDDGEFLTTPEALRQIFSGAVTCPDGMEFQFGYAFKYLCQHLGQLVPGSAEIYDTRKLGFNSSLFQNGAPIPIPVNAGDFPEIGHLTSDAVSTELAAAQAVANPSEDLALYISVLQHAKESGAGIIAFRH